MCAALGIKYEEAVNGNCGTYAVPGTGHSNYYAGVIRDRTCIKFGPSVSFAVTGMKVIHHPHNLLLIGADLLCGGRPEGMWNFGGIKQVSKGSTCTGVICFEKDGVTEECELRHVPVHPPAVSSMLLSYVSGPPLGGQCLRHV